MPDFNASNRKDIRAAEKADALRRIQDAEAITSIMSTIPGRAWMWRQLGAANLFISAFTGDPMRDAFSAGERNFGLRLLSDIMLHCPDAYLQMTKEANNVRYDSNNGIAPDADSAPERRSGEISDGGDLGQDGGPAEGSSAEWDPNGTEAGGEARH